MGRKNRGGKKKNQKKKPAQEAATVETTTETVETGTDPAGLPVEEESQPENAFEQRAMEQQEERTSYLRDEPISQVNTDEDVIKLE